MGGDTRMIFRGIKVTFSIKDGRQYIDIPKLWEIMEKHYDIEKLSGLGLNWTKTTMDYVIGFRDNTMTKDELDKIRPYFPSAEYVVKLLPKTQWKKYKGHFNDRAEKYKEIWKLGQVRFEIETFDNEGNMKLLIHR